jgi:hypothetical protein
MSKAKSLDGIISHRPNEHGGNVHENGIETITGSQSKMNLHSLMNVPDLRSESWFALKDPSPQWVCRDFHVRRLRPTDYAITILFLKSCVVESSVDGRNCTQIDRRVNKQDFTNRVVSPASFAISNQADCHSIGLAQTDES